jgi:hypothetical protein
MLYLHALTQSDTVFFLATVCNSYFKLIKQNLTGLPG